jgi:acetyl esterase/lipase
MVSLKTKAFKTLPNGDPLLVDIYSPPDSSKPSSKSNTIFLYYHPGGLVAYDRKLVNPHMVQACLSRGWTLVCPDYKLLPQVSGEEIWKDAADAYEFVATGKIFDNETEASKEIRIIAAGGSAGMSSSLQVRPNGALVVTCHISPSCRND